MNKLNKILISILALSAFVFASCTHSAKAAKDKDKVYLSLQIEDSNSRTAMPGVVNWNDYTYTLTAIEGYGTSGAKAETTMFTGKSYVELSQAIELTPANYKFSLTAFTGANPVFSGSSEVNLSSGTKSATFKMYPVSGVSGAAQITVNFPDDDVIATVKGGWSTSPVADFAATTNSSTLSVTSTDSGKKAVYQLSGLGAGLTQFAILYFYDAQGGLVASIPEGLFIVGGKTSTSTLTLTEEDYHRYAASITLRKDNEKWLNSTKILSLVGKTSGATYSLKETNGVYAGTVAEGTYKIYVDGTDSGAEFNSSSKTAVLDYYTVTLTPGTGIRLTEVSGSEDFYGTSVIRKGKDLVYKAELKAGFNNPSNFKISINGSQVAGGLNANLTYQSVSNPVEITTTSAAAITYTIDYSVTDSEGTWQAGAYKPTTYTVLDDVDLPTAVDLRGNGKILDGWKLSPTATEGIAYIKADSMTGNITLYPIWKDSAAVDTSSKVIYANGISLIIIENGSATNIYLDINRNGNIDSGDDAQLVASNGTTDFTGYELRAGNKAGTPIASDFTFTMKGGTIASIQGMGADAANRSILNISGSAKIGSYTQIDEGDGTYSYTNVKGVDLASIYNEWVVVNAQMTGDYKVVLITQYEYNPNVNHYVGQIGNSQWANFKNFQCFKKTGTNAYDQIALGMKQIADGSTIIRLINPDPIAMPGISGDDAIIGSLTEGFTLGDNRISSECSVFSVSVKNGSFTVPATTLEGGTQYLCQPNATTYSTTLATNTSYIYLHILSETNEISAEDASAFLAGMVFKRDPATPDTPVTVKVNLETVKYDDIKNGNVTLATGETKKDLRYFDGSFYMGVSVPQANADWITSYNNAKAKVFNGLQGYLINITSEVENNYIYSQMGLGLAWTGGARYDSEADHNDGSFTCTLKEDYHVEYDSDTRESPGVKFRIDSPKYRWQAGPEAGQVISTGTIPTGNGWLVRKMECSGYTSSGKKFKISKDDRDINFENQTVYVYDSSRRKLAEGTLPEYNTAGYYSLSNFSFSGTPKYIVLKSDYDKFNGTIYGTASLTGNGSYSGRQDLMYQNWEGGEPNDAFNGTSEECIHFLANGKWNDYNWNRNKSENITGYIVEFTAYGSQKPSYPAITKSASY